MTATIEAPVPVAVVMTTADGESRAARMWGADSYTCAFCDSPVFGPADWQAHEQANADHYAKRGEPYEWEPYSYRAKYWEARECASPGCVVWFSAERLADYRARELERKRREEQAKRDAAEQATRARDAAMGALRGQAEQLGFAWACFREQASGHGTNVACAARGNDRAEYLGHMKDHGARAYHGTKRIKLRKRAPAATMRKLEVPVAKWLRWDEDHREPGKCGCGHSQTAHRSSYSHTGEDVQPGCGECTCGAERYSIDPVVTTATRRGQFWSEGTRPHTFWVLPFEPAPWEDGRAQPVELHVSSFIR